MINKHHFIKTPRSEKIVRILVREREEHHRVVFNNRQHRLESSLPRCMYFGRDIKMSWDPTVIKLFPPIRAVSVGQPVDTKPLAGKGF